MSNFACEKCGTICYDSAIGYVTGCEHYPPDNVNSYWITLFNNKQEPILNVKLNKEGYKKYRSKEIWDWSWVEVMVDIEGLSKMQLITRNG